MATDVVMPQMGESIAEGTIVRWIKKAGEKVERDEPLLEISTDKVDAEIPAPASGTLTEILAQEGQTVGVNSVIARIDGGAGAAATPPTPKPEPAPAPAPAPPTQPPARQPQNFASTQDSGPRTQHSALSTQHSGPRTQDSENVTDLDERRRTKSSPLVRKIARENNVDITQIEGTGVSG